MATLEKRVQVLFSAEQYARLEAEARAEQMSVGAYVRAAVDGRMERKRLDARDALERLFERADRNPMHTPTPDEWEAEKDEFMERSFMRDAS
ncbi:hypothetical protein [uncultured Microbacterium sp.]|uniref:plasmid mobilization protein n=1 Tax=uncultured Microbacterium sp. TaxID=191216 RepID=UPI0026192E0C|nr:hypothetical protein [uncultured Microbacterium sp.]